MNPSHFTTILGFVKADLGKSLTHSVKAVIMKERVPRGAAFCMESKLGAGTEKLRKERQEYDDKRMESDRDGG